MSGSPLSDRVALVTGSTRGLGLATALELGSRGARVAMNYAHDRGGAEAAFAKLLTVSPYSALLQADVTTEVGVQALCGEVERQLGLVDVLVVNATCDQPQKPIEDYDWAFYQAMLDFFVKSPVLLAKACVPHMKRQRWGRIVQITSEVFAQGVPNFTAYVAAKGGQVGLARSMARELAPWGITVNMVAPGWIPVGRHDKELQSQKDAYLAAIPAGHWGSPRDVASAVAYLADEETGFVTGQTISVNGGMTVS